MIDTDNFKKLLHILGFEPDSEKEKCESFEEFSKKESFFKSLAEDCTLRVDFKATKLIYPQKLTIHDATTCNFSKPENFVVFECVHRLLTKGYKPEHIELEPKWTLGRDAKGGKADILVRNIHSKPYLLIECKTSDKAKQSEFDKEWSRMQEDGGQLFSYFQQEKSVKFLCLYTSDLENQEIVYKSYIIQVADNEDFLKQSKKKGYEDASSNIELVQVWKETYGSKSSKNGIFEPEFLAYGISTQKPTFGNLKPMKRGEIEKKRHEWATILRSYAVGDRTLALNKLMNLFLCKITDELENLKNKDRDLNFNWNGEDADTDFDLVDRLQKLYQVGMQTYLNQNITYHSKDSIEKAFSGDFRDAIVKDKIQHIFNELKYFSNGDFNFIEVYNESLFKKNFEILKPIVESLQNIGFTKEADSNILGDYFESYIHDMPQQEGQYFTPVPLVNFIIHSLPVLKSARVLDFSCGAGHFLTQYAELNKEYHKAYFLGIDKDQRLAKIAKIASFMHRVDMDIFSYDALKMARNDSRASSAIEKSSFNVLISNPPYSVSGFLQNLDSDSRGDYEIFSDSTNIHSSNAIECFFVEKASKTLQDSGLLALVLPNSLLNKDGIYESTRNLLLRDFHIIAIVELGGETFFKTGTNCIILFALRKSVDSPTRTSKTDIFKDFHKLLLEGKLDVLEKIYSNFAPLLGEYCAFQDYALKDFQALLRLELATDSALFSHENFKQYTSAYEIFKDSEKAKYDKKSDNFKKQNPFTPSKSQAEFIRILECEKFLYFCYCHASSPIIIKSPKDSKDQKKFLGYGWSDKKGQEGIKYLGADSTGDIQTPLYNPKERFCADRLNFYILQEYAKKLDSALLDENFANALQAHTRDSKHFCEELEPYAFQARLIDMLDFTSVKFSKAISLNPSQSGAKAAQNPFANGKYELVRLGEILKSLGKGKRPASFENKNGAINFYKSSLEVYKCDIADFDCEGLIIGDGGSANIHYENGKFSSSDHTYVFANQKNVSLRYVYFVLRNNLELLEAGFKGIALRNITKSFIENEVQIPLPPLAIQQQIVAECEKVEEQYRVVRMTIEEYQRLIKAVLVKCGICGAESLESANNADAINATAGGGNNSSFSGLDSIDPFITALLAHIAALEAQISLRDFSLKAQNDDAAPKEHFSGHSDAIIVSRSEALSEESSDSQALPASLLATLPTPPKEGWERKRLGEVCEIDWGNTDLTKSIYKDDGVYFAYSASGQDGKVDFFENEGEAIVLSAIGARCGKCFYATGKWTAIKNTITIKPLQEKAATKFVFYCVNNESFWEKSGSAQPFIKLSSANNQKISLPPLSAQQKITAAIENIEAKISQLSPALEGLEAKKRAILTAALGA